MSSIRLGKMVSEDKLESACSRSSVVNCLRARVGGIANEDGWRVKNLTSGLRTDA